MSSVLVLIASRCSELSPNISNPPTNAGDTRDVGLILGSGRSPGVENGNPLWSSCLENSMDKEAGGLHFMGLPKSRTQPSN